LASFHNLRDLNAKFVKKSQKRQTKGGNMANKDGKSEIETLKRRVEFLLAEYEPLKKNIKQYMGYEFKSIIASLMMLPIFILAMIFPSAIIFFGFMYLICIGFIIYFAIRNIIFCFKVWRD